MADVIKEGEDQEEMSETELRELMARARRTFSWARKQPYRVGVGAVLGALLDAYDMGRKKVER